ncbi:MAG: glycosyltransferase family 39 protein [Candidatus Doudnabacteria bacterium]|nr:glycosyltransferase family 39 protein [Candidatus Doudnabacteria bacterium]
MKKYFWLIVILITGAALRYYHNTDISLWHDEAFSALLIKYSWGEMMYRIGLDVHPPAYYVFLRLWHYLFGDSLLSLRSFSVFFSVGVIWAGWLFVKEAFRGNTRAALLTAALIAINPFQIQYATEARMYTIGAFFTLLAAYFLVKALNYQSAMNQIEVQNMPHLPESIKDKKLMFWNYLGFTLSIVVMIYTHYYLLFAAAAICFYGLLYIFFHHRFTWKTYIPLFISYTLILISYIPWLKTFLFQYGQVGAGYWIPPVDRWSVPSTLYTLLAGFGHNVNQPSVQKLLTATTLVFLFVLYSFLKKTQSFHKWLVLLVSLAPFLGAMLFFILAKLKGSNSSVYLVRYFIFTGAFLSITVAVWLSEIKNKAFFSILATCFLLLNVWAFVNYWNNVNISKHPGMHGAAKYLKANLEPGHKLYVGSSFMFFNLKYYALQLGFKNQPLLFSGGRSVENMLHFEGTAILANNDLLPEFKRGVRNGNTVWLVWTNGFGGSKPSIPGNWTQITEKQYPEVRPYLGANVYVSQYKVN